MEWRARIVLGWMLAAGLPVWAADAPQAAWKQLFNGKDLTGWKHVGEGAMTVEQGLITPGGKGMGLLYWTGGKIGRRADSRRLSHR